MEEVVNFLNHDEVKDDKGKVVEEWKDIYYFDYIKNEWVDYRGLYQVSSEGRVKSLDRTDSLGRKFGRNF